MDKSDGKYCKGKIGKRLNGIESLWITFNKFNKRGFF